MTPFTLTVVFSMPPWIINSSDYFWMNHKHQDPIFSFLFAASSDVSTGYHPAPLHSSSLEPQQLCHCVVLQSSGSWLWLIFQLLYYHITLLNVHQLFFKHFALSIILEEEKGSILFRNSANHLWRENSPMYMELRVNLRLCKVTPASFQCIGGQQLR